VIVIAGAKVREKLKPTNLFFIFLKEKKMEVHVF
jgi:hypothetical protein